MLTAPITLKTLRYHVRWGSIVFMALPLLIFLVGWLTLPLALGSAGLLCAGVMTWIRRNDSQHVQLAEENETISLGILLFALFPVLAIVLISGIGGLGPQTWDWAKHNAIFHDLITQPWPVAYTTDKDSTALVYYIAYYLPAAAIGKITGWKIANLALVLTTLAGTSLALLWLVILSRGAALLAMIIFVVFSGTDVLGALLMKVHQGDLAVLFHDPYLEWWSTNWQYSSNVSLLYYVPHQALAGWILVALIVDSMKVNDRVLPVLLMLAISALWTPFVTIGLVPFLLVYMAVPSNNIQIRLQDQLSISNLTGVILLGLLGLYYFSHFEFFSVPDQYLTDVINPDRGAFKFLPAHMPIQEFFLNYALFIMGEFMILWLILIQAFRQTLIGSQLKWSLYAAGIMLLVLPWFHYGVFNDLVMRTSIPALFILQIAVLQILKNQEIPFLRILVVLILGLGTLHSGNLLRLNLERIAKTGRMITLPPEQKVRNLFHVQLYEIPYEKFVPQYLGSVDSFFFTKLAKDLYPQNVEISDPRKSG